MAGNLHSYLGDMLESARHKRTDELLAYTIEQVLARAGPRQAEVLRRCAVPRWFDTTILGVLRESDTGNERVFELLREYSFVRDLGDGRLAYDEQVRQILLDVWRREHPTELRQLHSRLYSVFRSRTTLAGVTGAMPLMPESTMLSAVPMTPQSDLLRRETLYHLFHLDMDRGLKELRRTFLVLEAGHRLAEAELLLQTASETPLGPRERRWVQYLRARALRGALRLEAAAAQLEALRSLGDLEPDLDAEVSRSLGEVFSETGQWARATGLYRQSLGHFARTNNERAIAETMLLLGEAYEGLGLGTGSWHVPSVPANPVLRAALNLWIWLLALPFQIAILALGRRSKPLPTAAHCARYQNWLLIRLYNTARTWYSQAHDAFRRLDDPVGTLRAEQHLADILLLYGYHREARATIEGLLQTPAGRDPYSRAWLQRSLAECLLATGDAAGARTLLDGTVGVFREVGDLRREATVLYLYGRADVLAGDADAALEHYAVGLERFRSLGYAAARERILHELRAWERRPETDQAVRRRIAALVSAEPVKRYVGRFISSYKSLLQIATLLALPLALLLMAVVAPTTLLTTETSGVITPAVFFNPWRALGVAATLTPIYLAVYAAIATVVIYWLPITRIEREQPDMMVTEPATITRYDSKGTLALALQWVDIKQWVAFDRAVWRRPLALYSRSYLEDAAGRDLALEGITGWYDALQTDIAQRFAASGTPTSRRDLGYSLLRSWSGLSVGVGVWLLLVITSTNNGWLTLGGLVSPPLAALVWFVALSGALFLIPLANWLAGRPLAFQRALRLGERWPVVLAVVGGLPVLLYLATGGRALRIEALSYATCVWGGYVLAEALVALLAPGRHTLRLVVVTLATLLSIVFVARPALAHYYWLEGYIARQQVAAGSMSAAGSCEAAAQARALGADPYSTWMIQAGCAVQLSDWPLAAEYFAAAAATARPASDEQALAFYNQAVAADYAGNRDEAATATAAYWRICGNPPRATPVCQQIFREG